MASEGPIFRVIVANSAIRDINGKYDVCNDLNKFPSLSVSKSMGETLSGMGGKMEFGKPEFLYLHIANDTKWEYGIYMTQLSDLKVKHDVWVIARIDGAYAKNPIVYYYNDPHKSLSHIPPKTSWIPIAGFEPVPEISIQFSESPKHRPLPKDDAKSEESREDQSETLKQLMFGKNVDSAAKRASPPKGNHGNGQQQHVHGKQGKFNPHQTVTARRDHINQPLQSKDMRRVTGQ